MNRKRLALAGEVAEGATIQFQFRRGGKRVEAFLARVQGRFVAYENLCRHLPLPLGYGDNRFLTRNAKHFLCQNHGALFDPLTGLCVRGPCEGQSLRRLRVEVADGAVWLVRGRGSAH